MSNNNPVFKIRADFYEKMIRVFSHERTSFNRDSRILVLCAGELDHEVWKRLDFSDVTLSNLDHNLDKDSFLPFKACSIDAEEIDLEDESFDYCIAHAGLHHCACPPRALLEMFRVAKKGIIIVEPRESWFSRMMIKFGFGQEYEVASTIGKEEYRGGGLRFGGIPNFVYRFNKHEVRKCIQTANPEYEHTYWSMDRLQINWNRLKSIKNPLIFLVAKIVNIFKPLIECNAVFANITVICVEKNNTSNDLQDWLELRDGEFHLKSEWVKKNYK